MAFNNFYKNKFKIFNFFYLGIKKKKITFKIQKKFFKIMIIKV